jgi:hypothetical protein
MIQVQLTNEAIEIKNDITEYTISEYEKIVTLFNNKSLDYIDKYIEVFKISGMTEDQIAELDATYFISLVKEFNLLHTIDTDIVQTIELDGYEYKCFEDGKKFILSVRDLAKIENFIKRNQTEYLSDMIAVLYKRTDLTKVEHNDDAHIKHKSKLFKNLNANITLPFIKLLVQKVVKNIENAQ